LARLDYEPGTGYLRPLLRALAIPEESQLVVGSKTSAQSPVISPANPRLIFFNDDVAVAWPRGGFIEIAAQDPRQGVVFYGLAQLDGITPEFTRPPVCLTCHLAYATLNVPGMMVRSVGTGRDGRIMPWLANATPDHRTPTGERWSGWFVTGHSGTVRHLGNQTPASGPDALTPRASTLASLEGQLDPGTYVTPHSDIAALLVFDHQMHMMNLLTRLGWETRVALADGRKDAAAAIAAAAADVVDYLLFVDEAPLASRVTGGSGFAAQFARRGPRDSRGRSLRDLDLQRRLLRYPCSYMIYSAAFDALPREAGEAVYRRLWQVLSGAESSTRYARLTAADRRAIIEILRETKPEVKAYFL
jgi:hypothetical protein